MRTIKPILRAAMLAAVVSLSSLAVPAFSQAPTRGPGAGGGIEQAIVHVRAKLDLTADQFAALDAIVASAKSQGKAAHDAAQTIIAQMKVELAKPQPNLRALAQWQDSLQPQREAIHKSIRDQLLRFYDTLNPTQQQIVIEGVRKMAAFRAQRAQRWLVP